MRAPLLGFKEVTKEACGQLPKVGLVVPLAGKVVGRPGRMTADRKQFWCQHEVSHFALGAERAYQISLNTGPQSCLQLRGGNCVVGIAWWELRGGNCVVGTAWCEVTGTGAHPNRPEASSKQPGLPHSHHKNYTLQKCSLHVKWLALTDKLAPP